MEARKRLQRSRGGAEAHGARARVARRFCGDTPHAFVRSRLFARAGLVPLSQLGFDPGMAMTLEARLDRSLDALFATLTDWRMLRASAHAAFAQHGTTARWRCVLESLPDAIPSRITIADCVEIGGASDLDSTEQERLNGALH